MPPSTSAQQTTRWQLDLYVNIGKTLPGTPRNVWSGGGKMPNSFKIRPEKSGLLSKR